MQLVEPHSSSGPTYGAVTSVTGVVRVSSEQGAKARPVYLNTATGGSLLIAYHPTEEHLKMNGCEVQVRGRPYQPDPISAHILADHFDVIELEALGACGR